MAEVMQLERDLQLLRYSGGRMHVMGISSAKAVDIIARAREEGLFVTADVNIANLVATDQDLMDYDAHFKYYPPLRSEEDRKALLEGLRTGVIDAVSSDHRPQVIETKQCEFSNASFGSIGLESCFGLLGTTGLPVETCVEALSQLPRTILGLPEVSVAEGQLAQFTLFNPDEVWTFSVDCIESKSRNTPFLGKALKGRPYGIIVDDTMVTY
jgi:dihydroorotase